MFVELWNEYYYKTGLYPSPGSRLTSPNPPQPNFETTLEKIFPLWLYVTTITIMCVYTYTIYIYIHILYIIHTYIYNKYIYMYVCTYVFRQSVVTARHRSRIYPYFVLREHIERSSIGRRSLTRNSFGFFLKRLDHPQKPPLLPPLPTRSNIYFARR